MLTDIADATRPTAGFSDVLAGLRRRQSGYGPGLIAADLKVMLANGGRAISDLMLLRDQADLFGAVASDPTAGSYCPQRAADALSGFRRLRRRP